MSMKGLLRKEGAHVWVCMWYFLYRRANSTLVKPKPARRGDEQEGGTGHSAALDCV